MCPLDGEQRCSAQKADGAPCKNLALAGLEVCRWHGDRKSLARDQVSLEILQPGIEYHRKRLEESLDAYDEIVHIRAWRDYVEKYIEEKSGGKPNPPDVKVLIEANKEARAAVEAQTRIEYNKANLITQRDAAQFITEILAIARQTIRSHADLVRFLSATNNYFSPEKVSMASTEGGNGSRQPVES